MRCTCKKAIVTGNVRWVESQARRYLPRECELPTQRGLSKDKRPVSHAGSTAHETGDTAEERDELKPGSQPRDPRWRAGRNFKSHAQRHTCSDSLCIGNAGTVNFNGHSRDVGCHVCNPTLSNSRFRMLLAKHEANQANKAARRLVRAGQSAVAWE
ncbi:hypothetical protein WJX72_006934 [[Myrmecia] bisecta]|uniref:HNH endonuclease n=1 Tax=[Myrmecia] bisecta TaxID=41462 RepID=A0AAW1Q4Z0_9CHLO